MDPSILNFTKQMVGIDPSYTVYDGPILAHINTVFARLQTLGIGPVEGFAIFDSTATWDEFLVGDHRLNSVKSYMYMAVRIMFDPPQTQHLVTSMQEQINKMEWLLNVTREEDAWMDPSPPLPMMM